MDTNTSAQTVTPVLRQWIVEQARAGQSRDALYAALCASGWQADVARRALDDTLRELGDAASPPAPQPGPDLASGAPWLHAGDRDVQVLLQMRLPRVVVFGQLLAPEECESLIELARPRLARSQTVQEDTGGSEVNVARTSRGMFFQRGENALVERLEQRIATLLRWPADHGEGLQVLHYTDGAHYEPHYDYFDPAQPGTTAVLRRGGQRVATLVMYLNTPARGGATTFPDAELEVGALQGNAVFFGYPRAHPDTRTLHGGAPVLEGEKWVATKWLRERRFD